MEYDRRAFNEDHLPPPASRSENPHLHVLPAKEEAIIEVQAQPDIEIVIDPPRPRRNRKKDKVDEVSVNPKDLDAG